ncbi:hypothetical protein CVT24_003262 [Panaeolus cyanescens]|uniref:Uncharacterized protein n=1 Tax=Panaeolus cyanescens TaxID=181874 RepID=A0A409YXK0_9AGAR|nr:hypothetical protein CVT24_003262 [Panaeolus cyanescens]
MTDRYLARSLPLDKSPPSTTFVNSSTRTATSWVNPLEELNTLSGPNVPEPALGQLRSRAWLIPWSLFVYFNCLQGKTTLLDAFLTPTYLKTIQTSCPLILIYITAPAVLSRKAAASLTAAGSAPLFPGVRNTVSEVIKALYVDFDFEEGQKEFGRAVEVVGNDFFLQEYKDEFLDNAR